MSTRIKFLQMCPWLLRAVVLRRCEEARVLTGTQDNDEIIERVAALDIGKADLVCCARVPDENRPARGYSRWRPTPR